jgi:hypothetical protein
MARLTIPDEQTSATFTVTTPTSVFPITFSLFAKADLTVLVNDAALTQAEFTFTGTLLEGGGYDGGTVTLNTAVDDVTVRIERNVAPARASNFAPARSVPVGSVDQALNRLTANAQDLGRRKADLPGSRAGKFMAFDGAGNPVAGTPTGSDSALRADLAAVGGAALVSTNVPDAGAVTRTLAAIARDDKNIADFGGVPSGSISCRDAMNAMASALGYIAFPVGDFWLGTSVTVTVPIYFPIGARLLGPGGATLTANGGVIAGPYQIFGLTMGVACSRPIQPAYAEWFGAIMNRGDLDAAPAIQKALDSFLTVKLGAGGYYGAAGLVAPANSDLSGVSMDETAYYCSSPTAILWKAHGTVSVYKETPGLRDISLVRSVAPTEGSASTQGHGISVYMCSNATVSNVNTYNNQVDLYVNNSLSGKFSWIRGIRQLTGSASHNYKGVWIDGGSIGPFGGPSANPSTRTSHLQFSNATACQGIGVYTTGSIADLWMDWTETAAMHVGADHVLTGAGRMGGANVFMNNTVHDAFKTHGVRIAGLDGGTMNYAELYSSPASGATGNAVNLDTVNGLNITGLRAIGSTWAAAMTAVSASTIDNVKIHGVVEDHGQGLYAITMNRCDIDLRVNKASSVAASTQMLLVVGGGKNRIALGGNAAASAFTHGVHFDASSANNFVNITNLKAGITTNPFAIATVNQANQGVVSGHFVINPGATFSTS